MRKQSSGSVQTELAKILLDYRTTPHTTTGVAPAQLLMGRRLTTSIDRLFPDVSKRVDIDLIPRLTCESGDLI